MVEHSLAIHSFQNQLVLTGSREDGPPLGREVSRVVHDLLPNAIATVLAPLLGSQDGVLRIDRIALTLRIGRREMSALRLADLFAREIAQEIAKRTTGASVMPRVGAGFAYWPDHAGFAAAYLAHRLRLAPAPDWAFPDFRALAQLAAHEAALELIAARPTILAALARLVGAAAAPALAARLPEETASLLIARLVSSVPGQITSHLVERPAISLATQTTSHLIDRLAPSLPAELPAKLPAGLPVAAEAELAAMIAALPAEIAPSPARTALAAAVAALVTRVTPGPEDVRQVAMLARIAVALAALRSATLTTWGRAPVASDLAPAALVHLPEPARRLAQEALAPLTQAEWVRAALVRILERAQRRGGATVSTTTQPAKAATAARAIASRIAGIGLLLPAALAHGLPELLSPAALHRTLAAATGPEAEVAARLDPLLAALAPFDPRDGDPAFPPVPDALRAVVPAALREGAAQAEGAAGWAACLTHAFAAGLTGFETSSLEYLRRQFLARPGTLHVADDRLTLVLDPLPLGIVLRLSGLHGWIGRLPHARDAHLRIEIRES